MSKDCSKMHLVEVEFEVNEDTKSIKATSLISGATMTLTSPNRDMTDNETNDVLALVEGFGAILDDAAGVANRYEKAYMQGRADGEKEASNA